MLIENANFRIDEVIEEVIEIDESDLVPAFDASMVDVVLLDQRSLADYDRADARIMNRQAGKLGWALLWMMGIPLPVLLIIYLIRGH